MSEIAVQDQLQKVKAELVRLTKQISAALPPDSMNVTRFQHAIVMVCQQNPYLLRCNPQSLIASVLRAAHLGLDPDPATGQAWFVPFKGVVQFIPGYRGLIQLAWRSGQMAKIAGNVVREGDDFDYMLGTDEYLRHKPIAELSAKVTHAYATAKVVGGETMFEVMTTEKIEKVRMSAPSAKAERSPWITHWDEMAIKTVLRRLSKRLPMVGEKSKQLAKAVQLDEAAQLGHKQHNVEDLLGEEISEEEQARPETETVERGGKDHDQDA